MCNRCRCGIALLTRSAVRKQNDTRLFGQPLKFNLTLRVRLQVWIGLEDDKMAKRVIMAVGEEFMRRTGLTERVAVWEDGLRADTGPGNFEWWYNDCHFDDGTTVVVVFATKSILNRNGPLMPSMAVTITAPDGKETQSYDVYPVEQFSASRDRCDVRIGPCTLRGDLSRYELHAETPAGAVVDVVMTGIVPAWRPGAGMNFYDEGLTRYFGWLPAIPHGSVEGTLKRDGQTSAMRGTCYHDHNWGNIGLNQVMSHWYWGRAHVGDFTTIFVEMNALPAYGSQKIPVFLLAKGGEILTGDGSPLTLKVEDFIQHPGRRSYPQKVDFNWQGAQGSVNLRLRRPALIAGTSLLGLLPRWQQNLARLFVNPFYFRFNAELELEVNLPGVQAVERGKALYELMLLR